jgi:hypothetical protein
MAALNHAARGVTLQVAGARSSHDLRPTPGKQLSRQCPPKHVSHVGQLVHRADYASHVISRRDRDREVGRGSPRPAQEQASQRNDWQPDRSAIARSHPSSTLSVSGAVQNRQAQRRWVAPGRPARAPDRRSSPLWRRVVAPRAFVTGYRHAATSVQRVPGQPAPAEVADLCLTNRGRFHALRLTTGLPTRADATRLSIETPGPADSRYAGNVSPSQRRIGGRATAPRPRCLPTRHHGASVPLARILLISKQLWSASGRGDHPIGMMRAAACEGSVGA